MDRTRVARSVCSLLVGPLMAACCLLVTLAPAADHRDGPIFPNTAVNGARDINDIYIFQAPGNQNNTVMIFTVSPFAGNLSPVTFDQRLFFDFKIDNNGDAIEDITFRVTFGAATGAGGQHVVVRGLPSTRFGPTGLIAQGFTGQNIPVRGGGMFRAAIQDDPFFFDAGQFSTFIAAGQGSPSRPVGEAKNFFGPDVNLLAMILEIPTVRLRSSASNPNIGVWVRTEMAGVQQDRMGRPAINTALIPPVPRNNLALGELRNAFNVGHPRNDRRDFRGPMISVLRGAFGRTQADATGLADFLLPDIVTFNTNTAFTSNPNDGNGFPNGRRLRDDVIDVEFNLLTNGAVTTDNVPDDNGDKITDGTMRPNGSLRPIGFPYIGAANPVSGPPNP